MTPIGSPAETIRAIESAVARNLLDFVHAAQMVAPALGAGSIACGGGVAAFLGAGSPLTTVKGAGPRITADDIDQAETFFRHHGAEHVGFELAPWIQAETMDRFGARGYDMVDSEDVVACRPPFPASSSPDHVLPVDAADWPALMLRMNGAPDLPDWRSVVEVCAMLPDALGFGGRDDTGAWISCAQLLPVAGIGLFANDATLESARGRGAQTATIQARLRTATALHLPLVAAEVAPNSVSERNYLRRGFHLAYTRTHIARRLS